MSGGAVRVSNVVAKKAIAKATKKRARVRRRRRPYMRKCVGHCACGAPFFTDDRIGIKLPARCEFCAQRRDGNAATFAALMLDTTISKPGTALANATNGAVTGEWCRRIAGTAYELADALEAAR